MCFFMCSETCCFPSFIGFQRFVNIHKMVRKLLGQSRRLFAVFSGFWSFRAVGISSFWYYCNSCCFFMHLSGFLCVLVISVVNFDVWGLKCLINVRNSIGSTSRLFRCVLRLAVFPSFIEFWWFVNMHKIHWDLLGQLLRLLDVIISFWSFWITAISSF